MSGLGITGPRGTYILWTMKGGNERQLEIPAEWQEQEVRVIRHRCDSLDHNGVETGGAAGQSVTKRR